MRFIFKPSDLRYLTMTSSKTHLSNPKPTSPNTSLPIPSLCFFRKSPPFYPTYNGNKYSLELDPYNGNKYSPELDPYNGNKYSPEFDPKKYSPELWEAFQSFWECFEDFDPKWWPEVDEVLSKGFDPYRWMELAARIETYTRWEEEQEEWQREDLEQEQLE